jgi:3-oxoacyl-[acyl-carrier-protein] synthase-1
VDSRPLAILNCGLVTAVGLSAPAACAAVLAGVANPTRTRFADSSGEWIMGHEVPLEQAWRGRTKLVRMASRAIAECLANIAREDWAQIPLLLCIAERERPGRVAGLDSELFGEIQQALNVQFATQSLIVPHGRVAVNIALLHARRILAQTHVPYVLIAATDSFLNAGTLGAYDRDERLLTARNSNGFIPGEGAGALLIGPAGHGPALVCRGLGFGSEPSNVGSEEPLRGDGLSRAIKDALGEAGYALHDLNFRVTDLSGEQYYFKEAALAMARLLRVRKEEFDLWHPADCIGELGAAAGVAVVTIANAACSKGIAPGPRVLCHAASDSGQRAAAVLEFGPVQ